MENLLFKKDHRFFERMLNNDLVDFQDFLLQKYKEIEDCKMPGITPLFHKGPNSESFLETKSISTIKWSEYNVFCLYHEALHNLLKSIKEMVLEACEYYNLDFESEQYYIQGWFNVVEASKGKLDWHGHGEPGLGFHGYYCVKAEPSITHYNIFGERVVDNHNIDNRVIMSEIGHDHAMGNWNWPEKRITVAFDVWPLRKVKGNTAENHYIPLI